MPGDFQAARSGGGVRLSGVIDEHADLGFFGDFAGHVTLDLGGVRRINSFGVRAWIEAIRRIPDGVTYDLINCPPPVVDQLNMVKGFVGRGQVTSFYAPLACSADATELDHLFQVSDCRAAGGRLPTIPCPKCGGPMEVDDLEEQYLLFVREG